jgi:hypothetical protein
MAIGNLLASLALAAIGGLLAAGAHAQAPNKSLSAKEFGPGLSAKPSMGVNPRAGTGMEKIGTKTVKDQLGRVDVPIKTIMQNIQTVRAKENAEQDALRSRQERNGSVQKNLNATIEKREQGRKAIDDLGR